MDAARLLKLSAWSFIALVCSGVAHNDAQPLVQVQQFLQDYARGVRTSYLSAALESDLVASLLTSIPAEPPQFAGNCNITYDPTADTENRFAILLPPEGCSSSQMDLPSVDAVWQACIDRADRLIMQAVELPTCLRQSLCIQIYSESERAQQGCHSFSACRPCWRGNHFKSRRLA